MNEAMKLTKQQEAEIWQVYDTWLTAYLNADVKTYNAYFDDDYHFIGSTVNEEFLNRNDATTFFEQTGEQFAGIMDLRNEIKILEIFNTSIFITHFCDVWFINDKDRTYYGRFRLSSVMQKKNEVWRFIYQHFSMPDSKSDEGETIGFDKVNAENIELKEAIKRRTIELENKNRELEIEAALERVRARSSAMQYSDELGEVIALIFTILDEFDISVNDGVALITFNEASKDLNEWMANPGFGTAMNFHLPYFEHPVLSNLWDAKNRGEDFLIERYSAEESRSFLNHIFEHSDFIHTPQPVKDYCLAAGTYATSIALQKHTAIFINDYSGISLTSSEVDLLKRFSVVFEQTYTRFLDIQKAEAQAREAQIEVAVERVRAKALAMHKSTEILQVAITLKEQMEGLNLSGITAATIYLEHDDNKIRVWDITELKESENGPQLSSDFTFRLEDTDPGLWVRRVWNAREKYSVIEMSGDDFIKCEKWIREFDETSADNYREFIRAAKIEHTWHPTVQLEKGKLNLDFTVPPPPEMEFILPKMGAAFDLAYRRFLDLQKAEAQARESEIQLALERVRARTMAMQDSIELAEASSLLFQQMEALGVSTYSSGFTIWDEDKEELISWMCNADGSMNPPFRMPLAENKWHNEQYEYWKNGKDLALKDFTGEKMQSLFRYLRSFPLLDEAFEKSIAAGHPMPERQVHHVANFSHGNLLFITLEPYPEAHELFKRFAKVFDQTYTRFLDLQKAEAQTREAQINLAVERVRARALAMFKSEEILEVVHKLKEEIMGLDIPNVTAATIHLREPDGKYRAWDLTSISEEGNELEISLDIRWHREDTHPDFFMREVWDRTEDYFVVIQGGDRYKHTVQWLHQNGHSDYAEEFEEFLESSQLEKAYHPTVPLNNGRMCIDLLDPPAPEIESILKKMAGAFDLAYKRFEDLQKAEAQALEAQIEKHWKRYDPEPWPCNPAMN